MQKKAQTINTGIIVSLISVIVILVMVSLVMSFGAQINQDLKSDFITDTADCNSTDGVNTENLTGCGYAYNVSRESLEGLETLSEKQNTWAMIIGVGVVITLLLGFLGFVAFRN